MEKAQTEGVNRNSNTYEIARFRSSDPRSRCDWLLAIPPANVPLSYARLDAGYLNSGYAVISVRCLCGIGRKKTLRPLLPLKLTDDLKERGSRFTQQKMSLSTGTEVDLSGNFPQTASAAVKGAITRSTTTELDNVARETTSAEDVLNLENAATRKWRERVAHDYPGDNFRFVVIDRVLRGDKVVVSFNRANSGAAQANVVQLPGTEFKFAVTYNNQNSVTQSGNDVPLAFQVALFKLSDSATDPQFLPLTGAEATQFDFQKAVKTVQ